MTGKLQLSYVLPLKWSPEVDRQELAGYLKQVADMVDDVIVVDGSDPETYAANGDTWGSYVRHLPVDAGLHFLSGKVDGVTTGVRAAKHEGVVIADDDVRYRLDELDRLASMLREVDLVRPQNYFARPMPWHALLDTARTLLNRSVAADYPGTLGVRRSLFVEMGGYDGDVLFENLELIRTVRANGGVTRSDLGLYVERLPPSTERYLAQRVRQAYDDFALPWRMATWLSVLPLALRIIQRKRGRQGAALVVGTIAQAEIGRRKAGGRTVFPWVSSLLAPIWLLERGVASWVAVYQWLTGGVRYGGTRIKKAANRRPPARFHQRLGT